MLPKPGSPREKLLVRPPPQERSVRRCKLPARQIQVPVRPGKPAQKPTLLVLRRLPRQAHRKRLKERSRPEQIPALFLALKAEPLRLGKPAQKPILFVLQPSLR